MEAVEPPDPQPKSQQPAFAFRCDACGASSDREEAYEVVDKRWGGTATRCLPCAAHEAVRDGARTERWAIVLGVASLATIWLADGTALSQLAWGYINLGLLPMLLVLPTLVLHEFGHWGMARLLHLPVHDVQLGSGPPLWSGRLGGVRIRWLRYPILGHVQVSLQSRTLARLRLAVVIAAGPATHLVWIAAACWIAHRSGLLGEGTLGVGPFTEHLNPLAAIVFLNGIGLLINLIPARHGSSTTDGAQLLAIPFLGRKGIDELVEGRFAIQAELAMADADRDAAEQIVQQGLREAPDNLALNLLLACVRSQQDRNEQAVVMLRALYARSGLEPLVRATIANALAWCLCLIDDPADLEERDARLLEARSQLGEQPAVLSTWGTCLLADGRPGESWPLLANSLSKLQDAEDRATVLCNLARAEHRLGLTEQARGRLAEARALSPRNAMLERAERESLAPESSRRARPERTASKSLVLPASDPTAKRSRRFAPRWSWAAVPALALLFSCAPPLIESALTQGVPYHDLAGGLATEEERVACSAGLATLERWQWLLSRLPEYGYASGAWRESRKAQLEACAGNLEAAHTRLSGLLSRELATLGSTDLAVQVANEDDSDWAAYPLATAAFEHAVDLVRLEEKLGWPERAQATLARVEHLAAQIDEVWPERPQFDNRARAARLAAGLIERRDGAPAALAHVERILHDMEGVHADPDLVALLTLQADLLERLGRSQEASAVWARIGRAGRDVYAMRPRGQ